MQSDPRSSKHITYFSQISSSEEPPPDYYMLLSLLFSMMGFLMREAWCSWVGLILLVCSISNARLNSMDISQMFMTFSMIGVGLAVNYMHVFKGP